VYASSGEDCTYHPDYPGIDGVTIWLLDANGVRLYSTTTDANGEYRFANLAPGTYGVEEIQPDGFFDGGQFVGTAGGLNTGNDFITQITLGSGIDAVEYNFCEKAPSAISGYVFVDGGPVRVAHGESLRPE